jgi:hypothetical protein
VPRSVSTFTACACRSLASTKVALTMPVSMASLERAVNELLPITASSLTTERTFSTRIAACSTAMRASALGTSPVSSTMRL